MTLQSLYVLHCLRRCTRSEGTPVFIDREKRCFKECEPDSWNKSPKFKARHTRMLLSDSALDSVLEYLNGTGMIGDPDEHIMLTHSGFHFRQTILFNILTFLMHSVLLPVLVAFLTSLAMFYLGALFGLPGEWFSL